MQIRELIDQKRFTILLGKNGAGKSTLLRSIDMHGDLNTRYITPERGGELKYEPNIDLNITNHANWLRDTRRKNRFENFRQQSAVQFRNFEMLYLREIEKDHAKRADLTHTFDTVLAAINDYLPAIKLVRADRGFSVENIAGDRIDEAMISSGEAEFIAQAIEVLVYSRSELANKILLLDEPDVHLHPDLQARFAQFIEKVAIEKSLKVVLATHSTAILSGFSAEAELQVVPVSERGQTEFEGFERHEVSEKLLPIFGAHPLSSLFNNFAVVLVEGEDDRRVVEQFVRSSNGRIKLNPCVVGTVDEMGYWENWIEKFMPVLYDTPLAYSLRDLDGAANCDINDLVIVKRARLNCYAMENLLLTEESLALAGYDEGRLLDGLRRWCESQQGHVSLPYVQGLLDRFVDRRSIRLKEVRNIVLAIIGVTKPWEVHVGQLLARQDWYGGEDANSLRTYLGPKAAALFGA